MSHISVLPEEAVAGLAIKEGGIYVDGTFGRGGHAAIAMAALGEKGRLIAFDRDPSAIEVAHERFGDDARFEIIASPFSRMREEIESRDLLGKIDGIMLDIGVSSPQLDDAERGFSFMREGPLDMRMDPSSGQSAAQWLTYATEKEIADVLYQLGDEKYSYRIARAILAQREEAPLETTTELAKLIDHAVPMRGRNHKRNPATRSFQAIRIFINDELNELKAGLAGSLDCLVSGGRLSVISFHSLEDRITKRFMREQAKGRVIPRGMPVEDKDRGMTMKLIGKARKASADELAGNVRARSAVLRVAEKL